ncbi:hypothetical protein C5U48_20795 [Mycolicibacter virginiensis]|uniref:Uncharacterized protein n=1 Tax=Mycolicibacter virginiensis TaxID=1795032 RepID=A0A9X7NWV0_9MYCO|nr:hypothetical protein C5U48_20795 [Mycolicibacter virginiensis]
MGGGGFCARGFRGGRFRLFRAQAEDPKAFVIADRLHLDRIELDHCVAQSLVGGHHRAHTAVVFGPLDDHGRARPTAVRGGETDQPAGTVVPHRGQRAQCVVVQHDRGTAAELDLVTYRCGGRQPGGGDHGDEHRRRASSRGRVHSGPV